MQPHTPQYTNDNMHATNEAELSTYHMVASKRISRMDNQTMYLSIDYTAEADTEKLQCVQYSKLQTSHDDDDDDDRAPRAFWRINSDLTKASLVCAYYPQIVLRM